jgi:hypothetical protein
MSDIAAEIVFFLAIVLASELAVALPLSDAPALLRELCALRTTQNAASFPRAWCDGDDVCRWRGVLCARDKGSVLAIELVGVSLNSGVPVSLYESSVTRVTLRGCALSGQIKRAPGSGVMALDLSNNRLEGAIPAGFWRHLRSVNLAHNELTSLGELCTDAAWLGVLDVSHNRLADDLTPCTAAGAHFGDQLRTLRLADNALRGVAPFPSGARHVDLANNRFADVADARPLAAVAQKVEFSESRVPGLRPVGSTVAAAAGKSDARRLELVECRVGGNAFGASGDAQLPDWMVGDADVARVCGASERQQ